MVAEIAERSHLDQQVGGSESYWEWHWSTSKPAPNVMPPPTRPPDPSQNVPPTRDQLYKHASLYGLLSFKQPLRGLCKSKKVKR